jgi:hypothetical protein
MYCELDKWSWKKAIVNGDLPPEGRHGHGAKVLGKNLVFFGGENKYNPTLRQRTCLNDVRIFNTGIFVQVSFSDLNLISAPFRK